MSLLLLIAAAIGAWAWKSGFYRRFSFGDVSAIVSAVLAVWLMVRGEFLPAVVGLGWSGAWLWRQRRLHPRGGAGAAMPIDEARALLELPRTADAAMIRAAHRRLIVRVHPDAGGSAELARRVNIARDALISELNRNRPRAS